MGGRPLHTVPNIIWYAIKYLSAALQFFLAIVHRHRIVRNQCKTVPFRTAFWHLTPAGRS